MVCIRGSSWPVPPSSYPPTWRGPSIEIAIRVPGGRFYIVERIEINKAQIINAQSASDTCTSHAVTRKNQWERIFGDGLGNSLGCAGEDFESALCMLIDVGIRTPWLLRPTVDLFYPLRVHV
jgi:hypothetical protein